MDDLFADQPSPPVVERCAKCGRAKCDENDCARHAEWLAEMRARTRRFLADLPSG